jgi:hypothetical protein
VSRGLALETGENMIAKLLVTIVLEVLKVIIEIAANYFFGS